MSWFTDNGLDEGTDVQNPNNVGQGTGVAAPAQPAGGWDREAFKNASMSRPASQTPAQFIAAHPEFSQGAVSYRGSADKFALPGGEVIDLSINSNQQGAGTPGWTGMGFNSSGVPDAPAGGGSNSSYAAGSSGGSGMTGTQVALPPAPTYQNFVSDAPAIGPFTPNVGNVPTPERLTAERASYTNFDAPPGFVAPNQADANADAGYQFTLGQGRQALEQGAAAKGILHTGGTLKGLIDYGQAAGSQQYDKVYNRRLGESQLAYNQGFQTNQANNQGNLAVNQANNSSGLAYGQANNQNAFNQQQAAYGQAANTYGVNLGAQQQQYQQGFNTNQLNNQGALQNYQAQVNAALGQGNLALGYQNSNNSYALGQQGNALGYAQLGQNQNQFNTNQGNWLNNNAFQQNYQLANLGNPGQPNSQGYGEQQAGVYGQQGNAAAGGQIGSANAYTTGLSQIAQNPSYLAWLQSQGKPVLAAGGGYDVNV